MKDYSISYGVFVYNAYSDGEFEIDEDFLIKKGLTTDSFEDIDEDAKIKIGNEYNELSLLRLREQLEKNRDILSFQNDLQEVRTEDKIGYLFVGECSLPAFDHVFRLISEHIDSMLVVYDFSSMLTQGYESGEYDTGSLSQDPSEYIDFINDMLEKLEEQKIALTKLNIDDVKIWRIMGECVLRAKNNLLPVDGIDVIFDGCALDDDDNDNTDEESYLIYFSQDVGRPSFYAYLTNCDSLPKVDWSYIEEKYTDDVEFQLKRADCGMNIDEFEEYVRELFRNHLETYAADTDGD